MRPEPTSCITWAIETEDAATLTPTTSDAIRIAASTIVSRSASRPDTGSYAPSPYPVPDLRPSRMRSSCTSRR